jgi:putative ABC transport system permease protein
MIAPNSIVITTASDPTSIAALVRDNVRKLDKDLPLYSVKTMKQRVSDSLAEQRFIMLLLGIFAGIAMLLSAIGIYGVMSFAVSQRTREIGIRMALGAQRGQMLRMMLNRGLALTLIGIALGLGGAIALTRLMTSLLYEVTPNDKPTLIIISVILAVVAMIASYIPAHRSTKVDPMVALRYE